MLNINKKLTVIIGLALCSFISIIGTLVLFSSSGEKQIKDNVLEKAEISLNEQAKVISSALNNSTNLEKVSNKKATKLLANNIVKKNIENISEKSNKLQKVQKSSIKKTIKKQKEIEKQKELERKKEIARQKEKERQERIRKQREKERAIARKEAQQSKKEPTGGRTLTVEATAYTAYCPGCSGITATGINLIANPNLKVIAVDPSVIPLGSKVWVEGYGTAIAGDTGGAINGHRIDVFISSKSKALNWGRRTITVKILD